MEKGKVTTKEVLETIQRHIDEMFVELKVFLNSSGIDTQGYTYSETLNAVRDLKVMLKDKTYVGLHTDSNGYIVNSFRLDEFVEGNVPVDITNGYYFINKKGLLEIDYERKRQIEEV